MSTKKIKILFRHRSMEMGGVEKVLLSLLNNLSKNRFDITVLLSIDQGELRNEIPAHVKKVFLAKGKESFSRNKLLQKLQLIVRRLKLDMLKRNPKIIDNQYLKDTFDIEIGMTYNDFEPVLNSSNKNSKKIGWFHSEIDHPKLQVLVPKILKHFPQFDHMIYCSEKIKDMMHRDYPNLSYPVESVIINAIPIEEIKKKASENISSLPKKPLFVSVGRLHTRKGYHLLMDVHARLLKDGFEHSILIIGDGEEMPHLLAQQKKLGVEKTFLLAGNKMNPYVYIKNADFFIMPSESEAWPLVIAEALILQKPIIATEVGDVGLMINHKKTGYLVNYNSDQIYAAMKEFLTNPNLVKDIHMHLKDIEEKFDNQRIFMAVEEILENIIQKKNA
jgi:glycosyltransferase involved in cell wall biosynthesis